MGRETTEQTLISAQFLFSVFLSCQALGARKPLLLQALMLSEADVRDPDRRFSASKIAALCQSTAFELGCRNATQQIGHGLIPSGFSDPGYHAVFHQTRADSVRALLSAYDIGHKGGAMRLVRSINGDRIYWNRDHRLCGEVVEKYVVQTIFSALIHAFDKWSAGGLPLAKSVHFRHADSGDFQSQSNLQKTNKVTPCFFGHQESYLEFYPGMLDSINPRHNPELVRVAEQQESQLSCSEACSKPLSGFCYRYLERLLDKSGLNLVATAQSCGIAERTLRRRLVEEGTSFREILEKVRRDACELYFLENQRSLTDIATKLGYSELSAFTRAYTAWHGHPPSRRMPNHRCLAA